MGCGASKPKDAAAAPEAAAAPPAEKPAEEKAETSKTEETAAAPAAATEEAPKAAEEAGEAPAAAAEEGGEEKKEEGEAGAEEGAGEGGEEKASSGRFVMRKKSTESRNLTPLDKFHSTVRWNKGIDALKEFISEDPHLSTAADEVNGNQALHLAAQNGHFEITKWLIEECMVSVNCSNKKGQTPLHMSIAYNFYEQSQWLMDQGADKDAENVDGHKAITGIDGDNVGKWAWGSAMHEFKAISDKDSMEKCLTRLEESEPDMLDKLALVQTGLRLKKQLGDDWDNDRFQAIVQKAPAAE